MSAVECEEKSTPATSSPGTSTPSTPPPLKPIPPAAPIPWKPQRAEYLVMLSLSLISLVVALDSTILVTVLPTISTALHGSANSAFWTGTSYLLASAVFQPFIGAISDIFGRRELLLVSLGFFTLGSIVCCSAQDFTQLLTGRSIKGVGGGGILVMVQIIFSDIVPLRHRAKWFGFIQLAWAIGSITGPLIGGLFAQHSTWRWVFYLNFPFCCIGFIVIPLVVRIENVNKLGFRGNVGRVDWVGGGLFIGSTTSFLMAVTWGGVEFAWGEWRTVLPLVVGGVGIVGTMVWEKWGAGRPMIRLFLIDSRSAVGAHMGAMIQGLVLFALLYYISFFLSSVKSLSPTMTGVGLFPTTCGLLPSSLIVGILISRIGRFRWAIWTGWVVTILATGLLILWGTTTSTASWVLILLLLGLGHGLLLNSLNVSVQAIARTEDVAHATAMYTFLRSFGMCLGVAIGSAVFQNVLDASLAAKGLPEGIAKDATGFLSVLKGMEEGKKKHDILEAYAEAFRGLFRVLTGISVVGGLAAGLVDSGHTMDKELSSEHVLRRRVEEKV
ncbi:MFS general substrate transporter [Wilcoxina mikolae CBS 423.85]|nr:MFS general substrate transporter [Wilcoxina mikolae CBS 423.85]